MMNFRKPSLAGLMFLSLLTISTVPAHAISLFGGKKKEDLPARKLTAAQNALIDKAIAREKEVIKVVKERAPLVETYIQNMKPDVALLQVPESDQHFLGRVEFGKIIGDSQYQTAAVHGKSGGKLGFFKNSLGYLSGLSKSLHLEFSEEGFVQMMLVDSKDFNRQMYKFGFVRNDFLGTVPTMVFDVEPASKSTRGRFFGRIWIERRNGNIVRFNGSFAGTQKDIKEFYHFDSWRTNVQEDLWLPTSFYVEESDPKSTESTVKFKAVNHIWGYVLKVPNKDTENVDVEVQGATDVSQDAQDVGPLGAQRAWVQQAEDNVVDRLVQAGLLDAPSDFDKILEQIAGNILAYNNIQLSRPIRCRTLLTEPLESVAIGNTIIISKSLIDTTAVPGNNNEQVSNLYAVIAFQLAHVILGHRLDTKYAFNDRLLFPDTSAFARIPMHHTDKDNEEAAKKTLELLQPKELSDAPGQFGLYLAQLQARSKALKALNEPMLGDGLFKDPTTFWLQALVGKGPKLDMNDLKQNAAMPLSAFLRFDPWTDQVIQMHAAFEPLLSSRDKMPFEVAPVYLKLTYYKAPPEAAPAAAPTTGAAPADATPGATPTTGVPAGTTAAPADTTLTPTTAAPATGAAAGTAPGATAPTPQ
ncbi:hypothetical protein [Terriglobus saanensis]|uniref:Uncharacterized protein n=1 Tax=Terriglobus saanensis (strain ATCC BAA-1853 / DSM 23119 / SP1PR4) TaxID=401053 RepID=E8UXM6_TERSS|nr:hypothetical protein [Terriglobus saanensis]ADV81970.1 hypothetical protein AciPR4_1142 [Terriglobus saanensis SP1PR4]